MSGWYDTPFLLRLGLLLAVLGALALLDRRRRGRDATRAREYLFLLAGGALGGACGVANDLLTSWISRDYFVDGKGLSEDGLLGEVIMLGVEAGFGAGVIAAGLMLLANSVRAGGSPPLAIARLLPRMFWPIAIGFAMSPVGAVVMVLALRGSADTRFLVAWGAHAGLYAGALAGTVVGVVSIRRERRRVTV